MKAKKFSRKLLALFMAVVMLLTCFTGVLTSYAASKDTSYHDKDVYYNSLGWSVLSDEQTATALLDYADEMLAEYGPMIDNLLASNLPSSGIFSYSAAERIIRVQGILEVKVLVHSVDELLQTIEGLDWVLRDKGDLVGSAGYIFLDATKGMRRDNTSSCDIIKGILGLLYQNVAKRNDGHTDDILGVLLRGQFDLGTLGSIAGIDLYPMLGDMLGLESGYQSNMVYNIVQSLLFNYTGWFSEADIAAYKNGTKPFVLDDILLEQLSKQVLQTVSILVTYPDGTTSASRLDKMEEYAAQNGCDLATAAAHFGYDPNLVYSDQYKGNVLLFEYGKGSSRQYLEIVRKSKKDASNPNQCSTFLDVGYQGLKIAWNTVLKDTVKLVHVNYDGNNINGKGTNFDNNYYYWYTENKKWDVNNPAAMYSQANINEWANAEYAEYGFASADKFLAHVKATLTLDRKAVEGGQKNWRDIDATQLFNKLRYSPLADYAFDMQTGPMNLYFMQLGTKNLDKFFEEYAAGNYKSMIGAFNNALVACIKDLYPQSDNIYKETKGDLAYPELVTTDWTINGATSFNDAQIRTITTALTTNGIRVLQRTADGTDQNILSGFYATGATTLSESTLEASMIPFLIACIGQLDLGYGKLNTVIHPKDWDACKDAEGVMYVCLQEYLSYILADRDYAGTFKKAGYITYDSNNQMNVDFDNVILPMARDALAFIMAPLVPISYYNGSTDIPWNLKDTANFGIDSKATIWDLLNSVICYYADDFKLSSGWSMGIASLLGLCDKTTGRSLIKSSNSIWTNMDIIVNRLLPVGGVLQGKGYGRADSKDLLYNDIVLGVREIGSNNHASGFYGTSNIIYKFLTLVSSAPLSTTSVEITVYDLLKDMINQVFGPHSSGQEFDKVIPDAAANPFDNLLQRDTLVGTGVEINQVGLLQKFVYNLAEASGFGFKNGSLRRDAYNDTILRGITFVIGSLNSFIPGLFPPISGHQFKMATGEFGQQTVNVVGDEYVNTTFTIKNNSVGINNSYINDKGIATRLNRYAIVLKSIGIPETTDYWNAYFTIDNQEYWPADSCELNEVIKPGESRTFAFSSGIDADPTAVYPVEYVYDVITLDENGNPNFADIQYEDLKGISYQFVSGETTWKSVVYPNNDGVMNSVFNIGAPNGSAMYNGYRAVSSSRFGAGSNLMLVYPDNIVTTTDTIGEVDSLKAKLKNIGSTDSFAGWYSFDKNKNVLNDATGAYVTVTEANAIPVFDPVTGDLINLDRFDYRIDGSAWQSGGDGLGLTQAELDTLIQNNQGKAITTRTHIAYTFADAQAKSIIAAYHKEGGRFEYIYLKESGSVNYATMLNQISMRGPVEGLYLASFKNGASVQTGAETPIEFIKHQKGAQVKAGEYDLNIRIYSTGTSATLNAGKLIVGDDSSSSSLVSKYEELTKLVANYAASDFSDYSSADGSSETYDYATNTLKSIIAIQALAVTPDSARKMFDTRVTKPVTSNTTSETGDVAYEPATVNDSIPEAIKNISFTKNGYYFIDKDCTIPVYTNNELKNATGGKDAVGTEVTQGFGGNVDKYVLKNAPVYETTWAGTGEGQNPYRIETGDQAVNNAGELLYKQIWFDYYDANGNKVSSEDSWVVKVAQTTSEVKAYDGNDYRGTYTKAIDHLDYTIYAVKENVSKEIQELLFKEVSLKRDGLNQNDFDAITFRNMMTNAYNAENNYRIILNYVDSEGDAKEATVSFDEYKNYKYRSELPADDENFITITSEEVDCSLSSIQAREYVKSFNTCLTHVTERGYLGARLEDEIRCASGNSYDTLTANVIIDEDGAVVSDGVVKMGGGASSPLYGSWDKDGKLVNAGPVVYTESSWNNYVKALANAVALATYANSEDNMYSGSKYYEPENRDAYKAQLSTVYYRDTLLQKAEIALEPYVEKDITVTVEPAEHALLTTVNGIIYSAPVTISTSENVTIDTMAETGYVVTGYMVGEEFVEGNPMTAQFTDSVVVTPVVEKIAASGYNVSGNIVVATDYTGKTAGKAAYGTYTFTVYSDAARTEEVGTFESVYDAGAKTNTFNLVLPDGTYYATLAYDYALTREDITITVNGADITDVQIPVVACNFKKDATISLMDTRECMAAAAADDKAPYAHCDLNADGTISLLDTRIVMAVAADTPVLDPINIK